MQCEKNRADRSSIEHAPQSTHENSLVDTREDIGV